MSSPGRGVRFTVVLVAALAGLLSGGGSSSESKSKGSESNVQTVHVVTANPHETIDRGPRGKSPGDTYAFDADALSRRAPSDAAKL